MPIRKVKGGYQYGATGKVYKSRAKAVKQMRAIKAKKRAFTLIEVVIVISIIAIMSAVIFPTIINSYENGKQEIINTYNGKQIQVVDVDTNEIIYQGYKDGLHIDGYTLVDVQYGEYIIMYMKKEKKK